MRLLMLAAIGVMPNEAGARPIPAVDLPSPKCRSRSIGKRTAETSLARQEKYSAVICQGNGDDMQSTL